ncbi:MAG: TRAP transporter large permease subunit [Chloroflexota bacterium]
MEYIQRIISNVSKYVNSGGQVVLLSMMLITTADVLGRYFFNSPILGAYDITELLMVVLIFFCISYTQDRKGHIGVTIILDRLREQTKAIIEATGYFLGIGLFTVITWQNVLRGISMKAGGSVTPSVEIATYPFFWIIAFGSVLMVLVLLSDLRNALVRVNKGGPRSWITLGAVTALVLLVIAGATMGKQLPWHANDYAAGAIGTIVLMILFFSGMPVGIAMGTGGILGVAYLIGTGRAFSLGGLIPYSEGGSYTLSTVPLFVLMGMFAFHAGLSKDLFHTAYKWLGRLPGGVAMATTVACGGFAAVCGSSSASAATMGAVALPEMRRYKYSDKLATGTIACAGTIGSIIPPSIHFIVYGMITEQSIGRLFIAGIIPGLIEVVLYLVTIYIVCKISPQMGPPGPATSMKEKVASLAGTWQTLFLFLVVIGGIYMGVFTPTEAAGIGAFGAFFFAMIKRRFTRKNFGTSLMEATVIASMTIFIIIGTMFFNYFLALTRLPNDLAAWISQLGLDRNIIMTIIIIVYLILGCFLTSMAMIVLTIPIFFPLILALGYDPIWFGVMTCILVETGQVTPPYGLNLFIVKGLARDVPIGTIYKGAVPFIMADLVRIGLLLAFPQLALFLPALMKG